MKNKQNKEPTPVERWTLIIIEAVIAISALITAIRWW